MTALYHRLPPRGRTVAASLHGLRLRRWRYGRTTDRLVHEALERDAWSQGRWEAHLDDRLRTVLGRARRTPAYSGLARPSDELADWPLLDKEPVRADPESFLAPGCRTRSMYEEHTSGSTGTPLRLWWSRATTRAWYALFEARARSWAGVGRREPWALLGGQLVVPPSADGPPWWVWNAGLRQLYLSSYHVAPDTASDYAAALRGRAVTHVVGYPSALAALAGHLGRDHPGFPALRVVIANAEPVLPGQREAIEGAFGVPLRETYGLAELVAAASECDHGRLHLWPEVGRIEVVAGELVATGLLNADMPLVRYRTGDRLASPPSWEPCGCGRSLPTIPRVDGRTDDVVVGPDGRTFGRLDPVFKADIPIAEAQIVQDRPDRLRVRVVPAGGWDADARARLERRVRDHVGPMTIDVEEVDAIPRDPSGKFRGVVSTITS